VPIINLYTVIPLQGAFLPLSELVCSVKPQICDKQTSERLRRLPTTIFPSKMAEIVCLGVIPVRILAKFLALLHGQGCSRGVSRDSRLHPVKSRVHGVLHGVDIPAREVPRLLARFPVKAKSINVSEPNSSRIMTSDGFSTMTIAAANFRDDDLGLF
jgi:hypothetical protein